MASRRAAQVTALKKPPVALPTEAASEPPEDVLACSRTSGALFDLGSSFPRPAVAGELRRLEALAQMHPDAELLVFGPTRRARGSTTRSSPSGAPGRSRR